MGANRAPVGPYLGHGLKNEVINSGSSAREDPGGCIKVSWFVDQSDLIGHFLKHRITFMLHIAHTRYIVDITY